MLVALTFYVIPSRMYSLMGSPNVIPTSLMEGKIA
jgi:hypothetical protein